MGKGKPLTPCQIAVITAFCKENKDNAYISDKTGVSLRTVQLWTKKIKESPDGTVLTHGKKTGRPRKTSQRSLNVIKRQVEAHPSITARQLKERNPVILGNVAVRTVRRILQKRLRV